MPWVSSLGREGSSCRPLICKTVQGRCVYGLDAFQDFLHGRPVSSPLEGRRRTWLQVFSFVSYNDTKEAKISKGLWVWFKRVCDSEHGKGSQSRPSQDTGCLVGNGEGLRSIPNAHKLLLHIRGR